MSTGVSTRSATDPAPGDRPADRRNCPYDAFLLVSFGGPEGPEEVEPFLRNVTRGRPVPPARLAEVARRYQRFGGVSPLNDQCRQLLAAIRAEFAAIGLDLPLYWGNRNWRPMLAEAVSAMRDAGVRRALAFVTSPYSSYSGCRQYLENLAAAAAAAGPGAPEIHKIRSYYDHPELIESQAAAVREALAVLPGTGEIRLVFTAHSIPVAMDQASGPAGGWYQAQVRAAAGLVAEAVGAGLRWDLAWQSRSGPPTMRWLEPDLDDHLETLSATGVRRVVVSPVGFICDHLEVVWDLDEAAAATARRLGLGFVRAATPARDPRFAVMVRQLVQERLDPAAPRRRLGQLLVPDTCPPGCCAQPRDQ